MGKILRFAHSVQYRHIVYTIITVIAFINNCWIRGCNETTFKTQLSFLSVLKLVIVAVCRSWKNDERVMGNHGKIMEFDSGKALGTLFYLFG